MIINRFKVIKVGFLFLVFSLGLSQMAFAKANETPQAQNQQQQIPLEDIQRFTAAISQVKNYYVNDVSDQELFDNAIRGMLEGLDPHSAYLDSGEFSDLKSSTSGEFGGLGIEVTMENGYIKVISPIDDTPAEKAGIKPGDYIIRLDDAPVKGMSLRDAVDKMRGKRGSDINLLVIRKGVQKPLPFTITRDVIIIKSVKSKVLENGYGYLRISNFQHPTPEDVKNAVKKLQAKGDLKGVVLDLRNNPGGLLDSAVLISDSFLDSKKLGKNKLIVFTKGRLPGTQYRAKATPGDILNGAPLVVLINDGSASASEIVAGALQDHRRAILLGTTSFGKGSVQTVLPLGKDRGIKLTTALYYTPNGRSIQAEGIQPDILVQAVTVPNPQDNEQMLLEAIKEEDLSGHLSNGNSEDSPEANKQENVESISEVKDEDGNIPLITEDFQIYQALNLLKGMNVVIVD